MTGGWNLLIAGGASFLLSLVLTRVMIWLAPKLNFVDKPGGRKVHAIVKPLGGGVAVFAAFSIVLVLGVIAGATRFDPSKSLSINNHDLGTSESGHLKLPDAMPPALASGATQQLPLLIGFLAATLVLHLMGIVDDRRAMGPYSKLLIQFCVTAALVIGMEYLAHTTPSLRLRVLTALDHYGFGPWPSILLTIFWIGMITNAFNFLDNMDGLTAGVAVICATAFLITALSIGQLFVAATLAIFIGSVLGFLVWNFPPSKIFMGDSGSLVVGFILAVLTVRTTFLQPGESFGAGWYAVFAPLVVLAVPLYDLIVVSLIRLSRGKSPFQGDTNHFSHRLVARGMSRRTAVLTIYLVTAATSVAAILLPQVTSTFGAMLIFAQTLLVLGVVLLLEQHPLPISPENPPA